jgi:hypothetical protein
MGTFLSFLNVALIGLKQATSKGCSACEVLKDKVIIYKPKAYACFIDFRVTWDPCSFKISK